MSENNISSKLLASVKNKKYTKEDYDMTALKYTVWVTIGIMVICLLGLALYFSDYHWAKNLGAGILIGIAFIIFGALIGFLFGVPKEKNSGTSQNGVTTQNQGYGAQANTNLEQISDWLTKIIVGVGLTQLNSIPDLLKRAAKFFANSFQDCPPSTSASPTGTLLFASYQSVVMALILLGLTTGFLAGFLFTRLYLTKAFDENDDEIAEDSKPADEVKPAEDSKPAADDKTTADANTAEALAATTPVATATDATDPAAAPTSGTTIEEETTSATPENKGP